MASEDKSINFDIICRFMEEMDKVYALLRELEKTISDAEHELQVHEITQEKQFETLRNEFTKDLESLKKRVKSLSEVVMGGDDDPGLKETLDTMLKTAAEDEAIQEAEERVRDELAQEKKDKRESIDNVIKRIKLFIGLPASILGIIWSLQRIIKAFLP